MIKLEYKFSGHFSFLYLDSLVDYIEDLYLKKEENVFNLSEDDILKCLDNPFYFIKDANYVPIIMENSNGMICMPKIALFDNNYDNVREKCAIFDVLSERGITKDTCGGFKYYIDSLNILPEG